MRGSKVAFVELQVHHALVLEHNENSHAHDPYEYFRRILKGRYGRELNALLTRVLAFMEEVHKTPVLLSMLILCLAHREEGNGLPATLLELYSMAMQSALRVAGGKQQAMAAMQKVAEANGKQLGMLAAMQKVAEANMLAERREFTSHDVLEALGEELLGHWEALAAVDSSLPLVKTLEQRTRSSPAVYQFRHLSFQEALFGAKLVHHGVGNWAGWKDDDAAARSLKNGWLRNTLRIGGGALFTACCEWA